MREYTPTRHLKKAVVKFSAVVKIFCPYCSNEYNVSYSLAPKGFVVHKCGGCKQQYKYRVAVD